MTRLFQKKEAGRGGVRDVFWWTEPRGEGFSDEARQEALRVTHSEVCECGIVWEPYMGIGPSSIYFDQRDHYPIRRLVEI